MFKYLKFSLFHLSAFLTAYALFLGGSYIYYGLGFTFVVFVLGDLVLGNDESIPNYEHPMILTLQLWSALPLIVLIVVTALWQVTTNSLTTGQFIASLFLTGFFVGVVGTVTAHELTHRTWDKISLFIGRWLLAFSFDASFSVEHVYGHHRYVSTNIDPATAPRGRNVYAHIVRSTIDGNQSAWNIEKQRLAKKEQSLFSYHNVLLRGYLMSILLLISAYGYAGFNGLVLFVGAGLWAKSLLEIVNYMEHYGIVREPKTKVEPRHSWNTSNRVSSWSLFNLTRHSHHHAAGALPFYKLKPMPDAPKMISGYLGTILIALIPPLWYHLMEPKLKHWDEHFATKDELKLLATD